MQENIVIKPSVMKQFDNFMHQGRVLFLVRLADSVRRQ